MSGISFNGVGSGLPVEDIVKASVEARSVPLKKMQAEQQEVQQKISAYGQLSSRVSKFESAMSKLSDPGQFTQIAAKTSDESLFTATASHETGAQNGDYTVEVVSEAENYRWVSESKGLTDTFTGNLSFDDVDGNTLTDSDGSDISLDVDGKTLDQIRQDINDHEDLQSHLSANLVNEGNDQARLVINSASSGDVGRFTANFDDAALATKDPNLSSDDLDETDDSTSLDARIKIDDITATSSTNTFEEVVTGVTIDVTAGALNETAGTKSGSLSVGVDKAAIEDKVNSFMNSYNELVIFLDQASKPQTNPATGETQPGPLQGDTIVQSIQNELRRVIDTPASDNPDDYQSYLSHLGIGTKVETGEGSADAPGNGTLRADPPREGETTTRLSRMISDDFETVARIIGDPETGYAARFEEAAKRISTGETVDGQFHPGIISARQSGLEAQSERTEGRIEATMGRLDAYEERLYSQFNAIESVTANLNSQGEQLQQQFASLPGY
jgi:flagellar hook-associated protein 2